MLGGIRVKQSENNARNEKEIELSRSDIRINSSLDIPSIRLEKLHELSAYTSKW